MTVNRVRIPYNFDPRPYQLPFLQAMDAGCKRAALIWHRRSGKDKTLVNFTAKKMVERVGAYYYFFPTYQQGKKILWNGRDRNGFPFMGHIPKSIRKRTDNSEMLVEINTGSIFQVIGTDKIDSIVGTNPVGCVFSEYALQDPRAWDFIRPILAENGGWAVFNFTPRGQNHGFELLQIAQQNPDKWYTQILTVDDTHVIPQEILDQERKEIVAKDGNDALYQQEYMCSFDVPIQGAYYVSQLMKAQDEGRIGHVPYQPNMPVGTAWDLGGGKKDAMAVWFYQLAGQEIHFIDYLELLNTGFPECVREMQNKGYVYRLEHIAPHDIEAHEMGTGKTRRETAKALGLDFVAAPGLEIIDGIDAVRNLFPRFWFDKVKCKLGLNALKSYHKEYDERNKCYRNHPHHDWSSHGADGLRTFALGFQETSYPDSPTNYFDILRRQR